MIELNKIHNTDCLEFTVGLSDESIDLVMTDPPYGDNIGYGRMGKKIANNEDESINYKILPLLYQKLKKGGSVTCLLIGSFLTLYKNL